MDTPLVLISPSSLKPGDRVDTFLRDAGFSTRHVPWLGPRTHEEMLEALDGVAAVVVQSEKYTDEVLNDLPQLRMLARVGVGYDNIDVDAATKRDIAVTYMPGVNTVSVAELAMALILNCARSIPENMDDVRNGGWKRTQGREISGATLGIVGLGQIGKQVAVRARALGMEVIAHDKVEDRAFAAEVGLEYVPLEQLLRTVEYVSLHTDLDDSTRHLIGAPELRVMRDDAFLINTARGPVVDNLALAEGVSAGAIAGAALDVVDGEPLAADSPMRGIPNIYITPHLGGVTNEARGRSGIGAATKIVQFFRGEEPPALLNPEVLEANDAWSSMPAGT
jgi:phosphoglycerate dehydrogenase-like enzyme